VEGICNGKVQLFRADQNISEPYRLMGKGIEKRFPLGTSFVILQIVSSLKRSISDISSVCEKTYSKFMFVPLQTVSTPLLTLCDLSLL